MPVQSIEQISKNHKVLNKKFACFNPIAVVVLCEALNQPRIKGLTRQELVDISGFCSQTVGKWLTLLETKKLIYVSGWRRHSNGHQPEWRWGYKTLSATKPARKSSAECSKQTRQRLKVKLNESNRSFEQVSVTLSGG